MSDNKPSEAADNRKRSCSVLDGMIVEPCDTLFQQTDIDNAGFGKAKGTARWVYQNLKERKLSRVFFGAKTKHSPDGFCFNFCPYCGVKIDAPFSGTREEPQP